MELAGEVESVGAAVTEFAVGEQVFGLTRFGGNAEFVCVREIRAVAHKPKTMSFDERRPSATARALRKRRCKKRDSPQASYSPSVEIPPHRNSPNGRIETLLAHDPGLWPRLRRILRIILVMVVLRRAADDRRGRRRQS